MFRGHIISVILSEAKLQRSPESFRGEARLSISDQIGPIQHWKETEMFESLASCFTFRCSASLNSPQDESALADMTAPFMH